MLWAELYPPTQIHILKPFTPNVTKCGELAFKELIKVEWSHRIGPESSRTDVLEERGRDTMDAWAQRKGHSRTQQEGCHSQAKRVSGVNPGNTTILEFQPPELWENKSLLLMLCVYSVAQLCPTHSDSRDCSPPGSSVHGILQARILEWVTISYSRGSSQPRDQTIAYPAGKSVGRREYGREGGKKGEKLILLNFHS